MTAPSTAVPRPRAATPSLVLAALGIVYGDIGTSPLYTIRLCFSELGGLTPTEGDVFGILSLIFWTLVFVVSIKYVLVILRADNNGEGGVLAVLALAQRMIGTGPSRWRWPLICIGLIGTAFFCGDAMITPAISVLSAVEGLHIVSPAFDKAIIPLAVAVIVGLFLIQRRGTATIGRLFGPIMALWFVTLGGLGVVQIIETPHILLAINPAHAVIFAVSHGYMAFSILGAVYLAVTGSEALFADMGHVGRPAIRVAWFSVVQPALLLNYFGQGALILEDPAALKNPFYLLASEDLILPLVALATAATVIASQACISGAFSIANQAVQLGLSPRLEVRHTSTEEIGQIYLPRVNWSLFVAVIVLVLGFRASDHLGAAYGIAVSGTMAMTTLLSGYVAVRRWSWPPVLTVALFATFLTVDLIFVAANSLKLADGGWLPVLVAASIYVLMSTWIRGREVLYNELRRDTVTVDDFFRGLTPGKIPQVKGTAVFLARVGEELPHTLLHNLKHNKILHEQNVLLTVITDDVPFVDDEDRVDVVALPMNFYRVIVHYGFMDTPRLLSALARCQAKGLDLDLLQASFFLGRLTPVAGASRLMSRWRRGLFIALTRNARSATDFFHLPASRVVELGAQIEL